MQWKFTCQHGKHLSCQLLFKHHSKKSLYFTGSRECDLNKLHACILEHFSFDDAFFVISCLMRSFRSNVRDVSVKIFVIEPSKHFKFIFLKCTPQGLNMSSALSCYNGTNSAEGFQLLKEYGEITKTIDLNFVPSIEIDNVR